MMKRLLAILIVLLAVTTVASFVYAAGLKGEHQLSVEWIDGKFVVVTSEVMSYELGDYVISFASDYLKEINGRFEVNTELAVTRKIYVIDFTFGLSRKWVSNSNRVFMLVCYPW